MSARRKCSPDGLFSDCSPSALWFGPFCQFRRCPQRHNPCQNGAECEKTDQSFRCHCPVVFFPTISPADSLIPSIFTFLGHLLRATGADRLRFRFRLRALCPRALPYWRLRGPVQMRVPARLDRILLVNNHNERGPRDQQQLSNHCSCILCGFQRFSRVNGRCIRESNPDGKFRIIEQGSIRSEFESCCQMCGPIPGEYFQKNGKCVRQFKELSAFSIHDILDRAKCPVCKKLIEMFSAVRARAISTAKDEAKVFCNELPILNQDCKEFLENQAKNIEILLDKGLSAEQICIRLTGLCGLLQQLSPINLRGVNSVRLLAIPPAADLREKMELPELTNQGSSGTCWAHAVRYSVEVAEIKMFGKKRVEQLSVQELLDCEPNRKRLGDGGSVQLALKYVAENGLCSQNSYKRPEINKADNRCYRETNMRNWGKHVKWSRLDSVDFEAKVKRHISSAKPVIFVINAPDSFDAVDKSTQIWDPNEDECKSATEHAVVCVGYGHNSQGEFWEVANWYGKQWGNDGYAKITTKAKCKIGEEAYLIG